MGRKPNKVPTKEVKISASPKVVKYLDDLVDQETYGKNPSEVALRLLQERINQLIHDDMLARR